MRNVENEECGKCGVWKMRKSTRVTLLCINDRNNPSKACIIVFSLLNRTILQFLFVAIKNCYIHIM